MNTTELTWHAGCAGDELAIHIDWFDENNVKKKSTVKIRILDRDKPRTLEIITHNPGYIPSVSD